MIAVSLLGASQASVTLDDVAAVIRRFVGADDDVFARGAAAASGAITASASRTGIAVRATRRRLISCSLRDGHRLISGASPRYTAAPTRGFAVRAEIIRRPADPGALQLGSRAPAHAREPATARAAPLSAAARRPRRACGP